MTKIEIKIGEKFNRLTFISEGELRNGSRYCWFKCDCGIECLKHLSGVRTGHCKSCGCLNTETRRRLLIERSSTHSLSTIDGKRNKIHDLWSNMRRRCADNPSTRDYKSYFGRGIVVCEEWQNNFKSFYDWAKNNGHNENIQLDRIDNDKGYSPENCRFVTAKINALNKRSNVYVFFEGKSIHIGELSERFNMNIGTLRGRIRKGMTAYQAVTVPLNAKKWQ